MKARVVELRSDTFTLPSQSMQEAMWRAAVGDSGRGEDPTVIRLQELTATMLGKEAGLFQPSGTMSNLTALMTHCQHGDQAVVGQLSHIMWGEMNGIASIAGVLPVVVPDPQGVPVPEDVESVIVPPFSGTPPASLVCLENTHNWACGAAVTPDEISAVAAVARKHGVPVHLDGARLFNAAVALRVDVKELTRDVDSVCVSLCKGLAAPMGSVLVGSAGFIHRAAVAHRALGGGMRQVGYMAAAGIVALGEMVGRLEDDHQNARYLAELMVDFPIVKVDPHRVETNIVIFELDQERMTRERFLVALAGFGLRASTAGKYGVRMVTHYGISREDVEYAAQVVKNVVATV